ncbi:unnamed protein product [Paramecium sonneborni]|uniref:Uncharacterized protein n=1 Tax=Paramecium sonneborni TaxID=65129 RepID=A0A8S1KLZ3_9CILI|nr:unnamed protein product [Paramecium sonneborni]
MNNHNIFKNPVFLYHQRFFNVYSVCHNHNFILFTEIRNQQLNRNQQSISQDQGAVNQQEKEHEESD